MNALWGRFWRLRADYAVLPATVFTDPEVARVGLTEAEARATGQPVETVSYDLADLDRAIADDEARGFVKVVVRRDSDRVLGVTVVGPHAGETISEFALAMRHGLGLRKILGTVHSYPTYGEANKFVAGAWQRRHLPVLLLDLAAWFNRRQL
jgi:pyruvate/2-oxoglutarate dehydrogenase complex dihydrolipoamide dehydrogenase (E3) component